MAKKKRPRKSTQKLISMEEFEALLLDDEVDDHELATYFKIDGVLEDGVSPNVVVNESLISDAELEGARLLNSANKIARWRRNRRYRKRIRSWGGVKVVAEGDSWFQYPFLLKDVIDHLSNLDHFQYAIYGLSEAADLLSNIVAEDELTRAIERENPHVLLISAGGNDMVGNKRMKSLVHKYEVGRSAENYPNQKFDEFLDEIKGLYDGLFKRLISRFPQLKIVCHGYDNAIPANGPWLGKPLKEVGIARADLQQDIVAEMIKRFNNMLVNLTQKFQGAVYHVDCRGTIGTKSNWHDELHPKNSGYFKVAQKFDEVIKTALEAPSSSPELELAAIEMLPGFSVGAKPLPGLERLAEEEFSELVFARAKESLPQEINQPKSVADRRVIESGLEKVNFEPNFLPSSFLEVGAVRIQAICRIETEVPLGKSFGSGFLVGTQEYIMTNNHVLPTIESAKLSAVKFDYDLDAVEYSVALRPDKFFITSKELDFTIVACDPSALPATIEPVKFPENDLLATRKERVNIVQHPKGERRQIAIHDNRVTYVFDKAIRYTADTEQGSSGGGVFNNNWELCALHHAGWKYSDGSAINEGVRIGSIVRHLRSHMDGSNANAISEILSSTRESKKSPITSKPNRVARQSNEGIHGVVVNVGGHESNVTINLG